MSVVRNFKFGLYVNGSKSQPADVKPSLKGAWSGSRDSFLHFMAQERMKLNISNLVCRMNVESTGITGVKVLQYGGAFKFT